jgi:hypothetical protein
LKRRQYETRRGRRRRRRRRRSTGCGIERAGS